MGYGRSSMIKQIHRRPFIMTGEKQPVHKVHMTGEKVTLYVLF